jgi:hypothetical protein
LSWPSGARGSQAPSIGCLRRELLRRQVGQAQIGAFPIVLDTPRFDLAARIVERNENVLIEAVLSQNPKPNILVMRPTQNRDTCDVAELLCAAAAYHYEAFAADATAVQAQDRRRNTAQNTPPVPRSDCLPDRSLPQEVFHHPYRAVECR